MCGVLLEVNNLDCDQSVFDIALKSQNHRGPDSSDFLVLNSNKILIGNNRLAIIDQLGGQQPMASIDNKIVITFNGEVFNSRELRESLEKNGVIFKSSHSYT
jgi:asparagine synthase (glutamine-hydrolysing)